MSDELSPAVKRYLALDMKWSATIVEQYMARPCACGCWKREHHDGGVCDGGHACGTWWPQQPEAEYARLAQLASSRRETEEQRGRAERYETTMREQAQATHERDRHKTYKPSGGVLYFGDCRISNCRAIAEALSPIDPPLAPKETE